MLLIIYLLISNVLGVSKGEVLKDGIYERELSYKWIRFVIKFVIVLSHQAFSYLSVVFMECSKDCQDLC